MRTSPAGLNLIKKWEGCRLKAYQDSAGVWTIGYGLTSAAGIIPVTAGLTITQRQADDYLARALVQYEQAVEKAITRPMTQPQFDAMTSLCYNIGPGAFAGSSVVRRFNEGNTAGAADAFLMWTKAGGRELQGLVNRRKDERAHFLKPAGKPVEPVPEQAAPTPPPPPESPPEPSPVPPPDVEPPQDATQKPPRPIPPPANGKAEALILAAVAAVVAALTVIFMKG